MAIKPRPGMQAIAAKGFFRAHKWLLLRRFSQFSILALFLISPLLVERLDGMWVIKGNLASSLFLDVVPMTDPHILLQSLLAGMEPYQDAIIGAVIVVGFYLLVGGRAFCSWVCPVNLVTDAACCTRRLLDIRSTTQITRYTRYWMLGLTMILALATGAIVWELVNPVSLMFRGIVFGLGTAWIVLIGIFMFDVFVAKEGWCGRICPVGAFYSLIGDKSLARVVATDRDKCTDCMDCFEVCPEEQVIRPALKGADQGIGPVIVSGNCTNCGRCIDVCAENVFNFGTRFSGNKEKVSGMQQVTE